MMQKTLTMTTWQGDENIISFWYLSIDTFYFGDNEYNNMFVSFNKSENCPTMMTTAAENKGGGRDGRMKPDDNVFYSVYY